MSEDLELIYSPLAQMYSADGHSVSIEIYRSDDSPWILEVVDKHGTSTVWDEFFDTDQDALDAALLAIEEEGLASFAAQALQEAEEAEPVLLRRLEQAAQSSWLDPKFDTMIEPLSEEELHELDQFLLCLDAEESMTVDMLDGFLHAIAIGPDVPVVAQDMGATGGRHDAAR